MASKVKILLNLVKIERIKNKLKSELGRGIGKEIGEAVVDKMKEQIAKGISPIEGQGRFPAYKESYPPKNKSFKSKYPDKKKRPVNLSLSGDFIKDLKVQKITKNSDGVRVEIGFKGGTLSHDKEEGHRSGVNQQRKRPIIPEARESFNNSIKSIINKIIRDSIKKIIG